MIEAKGERFVQRCRRYPMLRVALALCVLLVACGPAAAGPNSNGAIIVHTNDAYNYSVMTVCTTALGQPASCADAITQSNKNFVNLSQMSTVWFLAAFAPAASPRVASVYFGTDVDEVNTDTGTNYAVCGPSGTQQVPDPGWPFDAGNSVGFGTPVLGNTLFRFYRFAVQNLDADPAAPNPWWCSAINPTGGYAAFFDDSFPPNEDRISRFGCVRWYEAGENQCPMVIDYTGACCFPWGECQMAITADCEEMGGLYMGDHTVCLPDNPCPQPGACCDPETGLCRFVPEAECFLPSAFIAGATCEPSNPCPQRGACCEPVTGACMYVLAAQCVAPSIWHGDWSCSPLPNNCPGPVGTEPTTWGQIKANYR
jgi:hypothetical protein